MLQLREIREVVNEYVGRETAISPPISKRTDQKKHQVIGFLPERLREDDIDSNVEYQYGVQTMFYNVPE